jgi:hypothetical protein
MGMYPAEQQAREAYDSLAKTIGPADECAILKAENDRLRAFAAAVMDSSWNGHEIDGGDAHELALKHGIIVEVPYDPEKHGESEFDVEPGDPYYVLAWGPHAPKKKEFPVGWGLEDSRNPNNRYKTEEASDGKTR